MARRSPLLLTLLLLGACDRDAAPGPEASKDPTPATSQESHPSPDPGTEAETKGEGAGATEAAAPPAGGGDLADAKGSPTPRGNSFVAPTQAELAERGRALQAHLDAGRKAVRARDFDAGIAQLEQAVTINPLHAKSLGELGWAYFNAGKLEPAQDRLERALRYADNDASRGAITYNLGRVAEARGERDLAIELYTRSLTLRANETVAARRAKLLEAGGAPGEAALTHGRCAFERKGPAAPNLCWARLTELGEDPADPGSEGRYRCEYTRTVLDAPGGVVAAGGEVTDYDLSLDGGKIRVAVFSYTDQEMFDEHFVVAVVVDGTLFASPLQWVSHPGVGYADENVEQIELRAEQIVPGGSPEIVIEWTVRGHDLDPGDRMEEMWSSRQLAVISIDGGAPHWRLALTRERTQSAGPMPSEELEGEDTAEAAPPTESSRHAVSVSLAEGKVEVTAQGQPSAPVGVFALADYPQRCPTEL